MPTALVSFKMFNKFVVLAFSFALAVAEDCQPVTDLSFVFFKESSNASQIVSLNDTKRLMLNSSYDRNRSTLIYCFGFIETLLNPSVQTVVKAYLSRNDTNVVVFDWSKYNKGNYFLETLPNVVKVNLSLVSSFK